VLLLQDPPKPACETCKDRGMVACRMCAPRPCKSDKGFLFCSVEGDCTDCGGAPLARVQPVRPSARDRPEDTSAEIAKWRATLKPIEEHMGKQDLVFIETAHFCSCRT
jgi:hypothetical protein